MYFLNKLISCAERFLFKNVSVKFKTLKSDLTFVFYSVFGQFSSSAFRSQGRYITLDPGPFEEWTKYDRGTKNKKQTNMLQNLWEIVLSIKYRDLIFNSNQ